MSIEAIPSKASATEPGQRTVIARRAVICAFAATGGLATNIFLPSLPAIATDLRVSGAAVTSSITVFLAIFAVGQLIVGPLSDRLGRQMPILIGLCIFVQGTIWCAFAGDLLGLLIGRSIQAAGACTVAVLSRAVARDLFDGQALGKVMASIAIATAAAPGFSPLVGSALDHLFGWRFEFALVAVFAICAGAAYVVFVGETKAAAGNSLHPLKIAGCCLGLIRDPRFAAPARTAGLLMAGVFAVFSGAPRVLLEGFGLSPITVGSLFASIVFLVLGAGLLAPRLSARFGSRLATLAGLALAAIGALLLFAGGAGRERHAVTVSRHRFALPVRGGNSEPAVERGRAIAIWRQGQPRGGLVRLLANGGGGVRCVACSCSLQRSGHRAWRCACPDVSCRADPAWVGRRLNNCAFKCSSYSLFESGHHRRPGFDSA